MVVVLFSLCDTQQLSQQGWMGVMWRPGLNLQANRFTDTGIAEVLELLRWNNTLTVVDVRLNGKVGEWP